MTGNLYLRDLREDLQDEWRSSWELISRAGKTARIRKKAAKLLAAEKKGEDISIGDYNEGTQTEAAEVV